MSFLPHSVCEGNPQGQLTFKQLENRLHKKNAWPYLLYKGGHDRRYQGITPEVNIHALILTLLFPIGVLVQTED